MTVVPLCLSDIGFRLPNAEALYRAFSCNILMVDYRGYGHSEGEPNEEGLMKDADAVIDFLIKHPDVSGTRIVLYGQSLGGAVALYAASKYQEHVRCVSCCPGHVSLAIVKLPMPV
jgi:pimeloyl-ACP methyl ester carboxylesterase